MEGSEGSGGYLRGRLLVENCLTRPESRLTDPDRCAIPSERHSFHAKTSMIGSTAETGFVPSILCVATVKGLPDGE